MMRGQNLLIGLRGSLSVAALVLSFTCGSSRAVLAQDVEVFAPPPQAIAPTPLYLRAEVTQTPITEGDPLGLPPATEFAVVSNDEPSAPTATPEENAQDDPQPLDAAAIATSPDNAETATASIAEDKSADLPQLAEEPLAEVTQTPITESDLLALPPATEFAVVSNDEPSAPTATPEENAQDDPQLSDAVAITTSLDNTETATASIAEDKSADLPQLAEEPLKTATSPDNAEPRHDHSYRRQGGGPTAADTEESIKIANPIQDVPSEPATSPAENAHLDPEPADTGSIFSTSPAIEPISVMETEPAEVKSLNSFN